MEMKKVRLGDIGNIITGSTPSKKNPDNYGNYALWIKPTDINPEEKYTRVVEEMFSEKAAKDCHTRLIPAKSICVPCIGTVGTKLTMTPYDCFTNQSINSIIPNEEYDNDYVYYLLLNFLPNLKSINTGTASGRDFIAKSAFENIEILVHKDLKTQQMIGKILSAYDDMIDNCKRQIALLEEAAQRIYINEVRQSTLEKTILSSIIKFKSGFAFKSSSFTTNGRYRLITIKNVKDGIFDETKFSYIEELPQRIPSHCKLSNGDIVMSLTGDVARCCFIIGDNNLLNQRVAKIETAFPNFSYLFLRDYKVHSTLCNLANGAAQQNLSPIQAENKFFEMPSILRIKEIDLIVSPYIEKLKSMNIIMQNLKYSRNILLPRLISGKIEINA